MFFDNFWIFEELFAAKNFQHNGVWKLCEDGGDFLKTRLAIEG